MLGSIGLYAQTTSADLLNPTDQLANYGYSVDLPAPAVIDAKNGGNYRMTMRETTQWLGLKDASGNPLYTTVYGYGQGRSVTYPGPTFETMRDVPIDVRWENDLPRTGHLLPVDYTMHMAHPHGTDAKEFYTAGNIPAVTHLHGGHTESASDGLPEAWFTQKFKKTGPFFYKRTYHYDNDQESGTLWYHDHALGITRLNVYAGLAGFYLLRDQNEMDMIANGTLPSGDFEREIVIQDRMFYSDGELFLPNKANDAWFGDAWGTDPAGEALDLPDMGGDPSIVAEFFGDFIIVNSIAWPKLDVQKTKYRFRMLNGSDSRVYRLKIVRNLNSPGDKVTFFQIGTDNGFLQNPVPLDELILAPGERADLIVDFSNETGQLYMVNTGPDEPFKGANFIDDILRPTGQIMRFDVQNGTTGASSPSRRVSSAPQFGITSGTSLRPSGEEIETAKNALLAEAVTTRKLALFEGSDDLGRLQPLLGVIDGDNEKGVDGVTNGSLAWFEDITETPNLNDVEIWEVYNATEDAHPIHLHLVAFQVLERRPFTATVNPQDQGQHNGQTGTGGYIEEGSINWTGDSEQPAANEKGWKDTFVVPPGYMGKVIAKFDRPGRYVWHCHILSHEDHEMMRPYYVNPFPTSPIAKEETTMQPFSLMDPALTGHYPNPFSGSTNISFYLPAEDNIVLNVFDVNGKMVKRLASGQYDAGNHMIEWDGTNEGGQQLPDGFYIYQLRAGETLLTDQLIIQR